MKKKSTKICNPNTAHFQIVCGASDTTIEEKFQTMLNSLDMYRNHWGGTVDEFEMWIVKWVKDELEALSVRDWDTIPGKAKRSK